MIRAVALTKTYRGASTPAVAGVDLEVRRGEIFGLLGPNGAGKTTTAGMLCTRVLPTSGDAFVAGLDVVRNPSAAKRMIGVVSQHNTLDRALTVRENLYFHGRLFGIPADRSRQIADDLLGRFHLTKWAGSSVYELSGGMAQRLMVARAIVHRPAVLFMDEPTTGLDPQSRLALWEIIRELNDDGQTVLLTTHYMEEAEELCDRVAIMDHGRIIAMNTTPALKSSLPDRTVVTVRADGDRERLALCLIKSLGNDVTARVVDAGVELQIRPGPAVVNRLVRAADDAGFEISGLTVEEPSLETVFISLTGRELRD